MKPVALVTGIRGQDGFYLARALLRRGYEVIGTSRESTGPQQGFVVDDVTIEVRALDVRDAPAFRSLLRSARPSRVFNLAARASSAQLFDDPIATAEVNGLAVMKMLEEIRLCDPSTRFCQASSCEVFAGTQSSPQDEQTLRAPRSAYGAAKAFADHCVAAYRSTYGLHASSAILYPHESPRRDRHFLVRKVVSAAVSISRGEAETLSLGDLDAIRDWGASEDYMTAMVMMSELSEPQDFVLASGVGHSVRDVCEVAFGKLGLSWTEHVVTDPALHRGPDPVPKIGRASKARDVLGWTPTASFHDLVARLVEIEAELRDA